MWVNHNNVWCTRTWCSLINSNTTFSRLDRSITEYMTIHASRELLLTTSRTCLWARGSGVWGSGFRYEHIIRSSRVLMISCIWSYTVCVCLLCEYSEVETMHMHMLSETVRIYSLKWHVSPHLYTSENALLWRPMYVFICSRSMYMKSLTSLLSFCGSLWSLFGWDATRYLSESLYYSEYSRATLVILGFIRFSSMSSICCNWTVKSFRYKSKKKFLF